MKCKIFANANCIKEYEGWINLLLNVVNSTQKLNDYFDLATPLDSATKKMESLAKDNLEINKKIIKEIKKYDYKYLTNNHNFLSLIFSLKSN